MRSATPRNPWSLAFAAIALGLIGCAVGLTQRAPTTPSVTRVRAPVARAAQVIQVVGGPRVPHDVHTELGLECADCHEPSDAGEPGAPELEFCLDCHEEMEEDEEVPAEKQVANVFFTEDGKPRWRRGVKAYGGDVVFAHGPHAGKVECAACHGDMKGTQRVAKELFTMAECMACHQQRSARNDCGACHRQISDKVAPPDHRMEWETRHGQVVLTSQRGGEAATCHYCHQNPDFCHDCHVSRVPSSHVTNWESGHGQRVLAAGGPGEARCTFCHSDQTFCDDCHMNVQPSSHKHMWLRRHGGMVRAQGVSGQARCEFCHHQPAFCEECHRDVEPRDHTTLFRTRTHGVMAAMDRSRCMVCHQPDFCIRCHEYTSPRSHRGMWARGRNTHCVQCHYPIGANQNCRVCHKQNPTHDTAPPIPTSHPSGMNCRICHNAAGGGGASPLRHVDNRTPCQACHQ